MEVTMHVRGSLPLFMLLAVAVPAVGVRNPRLRYSEGKRSMTVPSWSNS